MPRVCESLKMNKKFSSPIISSLIVGLIVIFWMFCIGLRTLGSTSVNLAGDGVRSQLFGIWHTGARMTNLTALPKGLAGTKIAFFDTTTFRAFIDNLVSNGGRSSECTDTGIDFDSIFHYESEQGVYDYYAMRVIRCDQAGDYPFLVRNTGAMGVYVNGCLADWAPRDRGNYAAQDFIVLSLNAGDNHIVVHILSIGSRASFSIDPKKSLDDALASVAKQRTTFFP